MTPEQTKLAELVDIVYRDLAELPPPRRYYFVDSPEAGLLAVALLKQWYTSEDTQDEIPPDENLSAWDLEAAVMALQQQGRIPADLQEAVYDAPQWALGYDDIYGNYTWSAIYDNYTWSATEKPDPMLSTEIELKLHLYWPMNEVVVIVLPPTQIWRDQNNLPHHNELPAVQYRDGTGLYFQNGVPITTGCNALEPLLVGGLMAYLQESATVK